jgi:hypothetical protein
VILVTMVRSASVAAVRAAAAKIAFVFHHLEDQS